MRKRIAFYLLLFSFQLHGQVVPDYKLLTTADGLSQGMIFDILQSRDGFIWIATKDGLNRYDGDRFEVFSPDPFDPFAIGYSEVRSVFEDSRGWIWVGFVTEVDVLDPKTGRFYHVTHNGDKNFTGKGQWMTFEETPDGDIWVANVNELWELDIPIDLLTRASQKDASTIEPACKVMPKPHGWPSIFKEKNLLTATAEGLFQLDPVTGKTALKMPAPGWVISGLLMDAQGNITGRADNIGKGWSQLILISNSGIQPLPIHALENYAPGPDGSLWVAANNGSIQKWKRSSLPDWGMPEFELKTDDILGKSGAFGCTKIIVDKSGVVWVGTSGYGIFKISPKASNFKKYKLTARRYLEGPDGGIYSLYEPQVKYHLKSFQTATSHSDFWAPSDKFEDNSGFSACFDAAGNGWSGDRRTKLLYRTDAQTKSIRSFPWNAGSGLIVSRSGALLSVSEKGLLKFDPGTETSTAYPFDKPQKITTLYSYFLYEDIDGAVWIFGLEGLTKAVPTSVGYQFDYLRNNPDDRSSLSSDIVLSVADDPIEPGRYLWVGTKGGGLNRLDKKTNQFKQYKTTEGLPDNVVYGILAENLSPTLSTGEGAGYIWLSTNKGLCRFHVREETTKNFITADGLQDNEFNSSSYLKLRDGAMIFGGVKGISVFHPDSLRFNEFVPQTHIVGLKVNNRKFDISGRSSITLSHDQNLLTFDFAALDFTNPSKNLYRYQLVGVDKEWVPLGAKNSVQFANLAPGTYTFKVLGSNNDGFWCEQAAELQFTIRPPWWSSWWAYLIYAMLAAAAIGAYYRYQLRQKLEHQETVRLRELDDFKSRFFTNITHEFRTPLTVMLGMSEQLAKGESDEAKRNKIGLIKRSGENLLRLVNQILDLSKLESNALKMNYVQGDVLNFIRYIAESMHSLANAQNLMLRVESDQGKIVMDYDPERFLQIVHNLLSNAIKFTPSGGRVVLQARVSDQWLHLSVADSGAGIPPDELPHIFERFFQAKNQEHLSPSLSGRAGVGTGGTGIGLSLTRELVKAMGGGISVESTVGAGSTFFVKLPVTNNSAFEEKNLIIPKTSPTPSYSPPAATKETDGPNLLLIEDNPDVVEYLRACLEDGGDRERRPDGDMGRTGDHKGHRYVLDFAYNGQAGIEKALENIPDLIVSDVMMPFKDGFEVLEALKNDERTSHIPIILLTAKADVQSRLAGLRKGADAYLSKPFHQEELLVTVTNLLETRKKLQLKYQQNLLAVNMPATTSPANDLEDAFLQNIRAIIDANYTKEDFGLPQLCQKIGMSRSQLFRKMKALTDIAPSDLIRSHRLHKAKVLLESGAANVAEAAWQVGFKDSSYFSKLYQEEFGVAPGTAHRFPT